MAPNAALSLFYVSLYCPCSQRKESFVWKGSVFVCILVTCQLKKGYCLLCGAGLVAEWSSGHTALWFYSPILLAPLGHLSLYELPFFYLCVWVLYLYVYHVSVVLRDVRGRCRMPWNWSFTWF